MFYTICYKLNAPSNSIFFNQINKFDIYKKLITYNLNKDHIQIFIKSQKIYHILNNFVYKYKIKKYNIINENDLYLDKININNKNNIKLLIDNSVYIFTLKDINYIINMKLLFMDDGKVSSQPIRNPYTNTIINHNNLYNIYFHIRKYKINMVYHLLYINNFNIKNFTINHRDLINYYSIHYNINTSSNNFLYKNILNMFRYFDKYFNIIYLLTEDVDVIIRKYKKLLYFYLYILNSDISINTFILYKYILIKEIYYSIDREILHHTIKNNESYKIILSDPNDIDTIYSNIENYNNSYNRTNVFRYYNHITRSSFSNDNSNNSINYTNTSYNHSINHNIDNPNNNIIDNSYNLTIPCDLSNSLHNPLLPTYSLNNPLLSKLINYSSYNFITNLSNLIYINSINYINSIKLLYNNNNNKKFNQIIKITLIIIKITEIYIFYQSIILINKINNLI